MNQKPYLLISALVFGIVAVLHLLRVILGLEVDVGGSPTPMALSWVGFVGAGALSVWSLRLLQSGD